MSARLSVAGTGSESDPAGKVEFELKEERDQSRVQDSESNSHVQSRTEDLELGETNRSGSRAHASDFQSNRFCNDVVDRNDKSGAIIRQRPNGID